MSNEEHTVFCGICNGSEVGPWVGLHLTKSVRLLPTTSRPVKNMELVAPVSCHVGMAYMVMSDDDGGGEGEGEEDEEEEEEEEEEDEEGEGEGEEEEEEEEEEEDHCLLRVI